MGWIGTITGIIGAIILSLNTEYSKFAFILYLISSISWMFESYKIRNKSLFLLNFVFTVINFIAIKNWLF